MHLRRSYAWYLGFVLFHPTKQFGSVWVGFLLPPGTTATMAPWFGNGRSDPYALSDDDIRAVAASFQTPFVPLLMHKHTTRPEQKIEERVGAWKRFAECGLPAGLEDFVLRVNLPSTP